MAGEPEYQFGLLAFVEVADDGTMYAMDVQAQEARAYDPQGTTSGPSEAPVAARARSAPGAVFIFDDGQGGLVIPDLGNQRVNRYHPRG